jgi:hypothetical protein
MTMPEYTYAKVMRPDRGWYVVIGERARCTFKVFMVKDLLRSLRVGNTTLKHRTKMARRSFCFSG